MGSGVVGVMGDEGERRCGWGKGVGMVGEGESCIF